MEFFRQSIQKKCLSSAKVITAELTKMSVLNQSGEEQVECPLCMEPLEVDDLTFFPCTCGYQVNIIFYLNY